MAKDYKNLTEASVKQKKPRAKSKKATPAEKLIPGWLWLVSGVLIGGFVSFIVYLKLYVSVESDIAVKQQVKIEKKAPEKKMLEPAKETEDGMLEFYNILTSPRDSKHTTDNVENKNKALEQIKQPAVEIKKPITSKDKPGVYIYTLQVGSFLAFKDADTRKANLGMLGIGSRIHAIKNRNKTYYRVLVGPYDDIKRVNKIDAQMKRNNIKTLLLREKG